MGEYCCFGRKESKEDLRDAIVAKDRELARLREENAGLEAHNALLRATVKQLSGVEFDRDRLREALEKIASGKHECFTSFDGRLSCGGGCMLAIAERALKSQLAASPND